MTFQTQRSHYPISSNRHTDDCPEQLIPGASGDVPQEQEQTEERAQQMERLASTELFPSFKTPASRIWRLRCFNCS